MFPSPAGASIVLLCASFPKRRANPCGRCGQSKNCGKGSGAKDRKGAHFVDFELDLPKGETTLETFLYTEKNEVGGAYFTEVKLIVISNDLRMA